MQGQFAVSVWWKNCSLHQSELSLQNHKSSIGDIKPHLLAILELSSFLHIMVVSLLILELSLIPSLSTTDWWENLVWKPSAACTRAVLSSCSLDNWCHITLKTYKILHSIYVKATCYLSHMQEKEKKFLQMWRMQWCFLTKSSIDGSELHGTCQCPFVAVSYIFRVNFVCHICTCPWLARKNYKGTWSLRCLHSLIDSASPICARLSLSLASINSACFGDS